MGEFFRRLLACERRTERYRRIIVELTRQVRDLQQQLANLRGKV